MMDVKEKVLQVMRSRAALQDKALGGEYPFMMATWNLRLNSIQRYLCQPDWSGGMETGGEVMSWPEAFTTVGIAMAVALVLYSICRWG